MHDAFHIAKRLNEAVNAVKRAEHKALLALGDEWLKHIRQLWLASPLKWTREQTADFQRLKDSGQKVGRAIKELFTKLGGCRREKAARAFFRRWFAWASRSELKPAVKAARMLKRHLENILTNCRHPASNAVTEGLNSKIQSIKSNARGFRSFHNCRIRILFLLRQTPAPPAIKPEEAVKQASAKSSRHGTVEDGSDAFPAKPAASQTCPAFFCNL